MENIKHEIELLEKDIQIFFERQDKGLEKLKTRLMEVQLR